MGRWSQCRRRGGTTHQGILLPPLDTDWTVTMGAAGCVDATKLVDFPPPADRWQVRDRRVGTTTWNNHWRQSSGIFNLCGYPDGVEVEVQACWWSQTAQLSPWTESKTGTTGPPP